MKCRQIDPTTGAIVWFGKSISSLKASKFTIASYSLKVGGNRRIDNYVEDRAAIICSLIQRLSVIKNELWFAYNYGIPLTDKVKNKAIMDASVADIILKTNDVLSIDAFESEQIGHDYSCYFIATTKYGKIEIGM